MRSLLLIRDKRTHIRVVAIRDDAWRPRCQAMYEDFAMTIEILHLAIQRWLNHRVARHLAAQAERLTR